MTIASEITRINNNIASAYTTCNNKGATMPVNQNSANLADCIDSIVTGGFPREVVNGTYVMPISNCNFKTPNNATDLGDYALVGLYANNLIVELGDGNQDRINKSSAGIKNVDLSSLTRISGKGAMFQAFYGTGITNLDLSNVTSINGKDALNQACYNCTNLASVDLSSLTTIGDFALYDTFKNCTSLTTINTDFSSITSVGDMGLNSTFEGCTNLTGSVDFSNLNYISENYGSSLGNTFYGTGITSVNLSGLTAITSAFYSTFANCTHLTSVNLSGVIEFRAYNLFKGCTSLTSISFPNLTTISGGGFQGCTSLSSVSIPNLTTVGTMVSCFQDCTSLTSVDFLSNIQTITSSNALKNAFQGCTSLNSISFNNLKKLGQNTGNSYTTNYGHFTSAFSGCTNITSLTFPELTEIYCTGNTTSTNGTFANNETIKKFYFPKLNTISYIPAASSTNQNACKNIFKGCTSLEEIHFGAANQSAIEASPGYSTLWGIGAGNATVYFDL